MFLIDGKIEHIIYIHKNLDNNSNILVDIANILFRLNQNFFYIANIQSN